MEADVQKKYGHLMAMARNLSSDVQSEALHVTIRALLKIIQMSKKQGFRLANPSTDFLDMIDALIQNTELSIDLAIVAARINCLTKVFIQNKPSAIEQLIVHTLQGVGRVPKICLLFGIIDCLPNDRWDTTVVTIAKEILQLLLDFNSEYFYQMKLFHTWLQYVQNIVIFIPNSNPIWTHILVPQNDAVELINLHWETGEVQNLSEQCLATICSIWRTSEQTSQYADVVAKITLSNLTWHSKSKYQILATLLPFIRFKELLSQYPDSIYAMAVSLSSHSKFLLAAGTKLFKALAKHLTPDDWKDYCQSVLLDALNQSNNVDRQRNAAHHWLPCLAHTRPIVLMELKQHLLKTTQFNWLAYILLLKLTDHLDENDRLLTLTAIHHGDEDVKIAAFEILLCKNQRTETICPNDWSLVSNFLVNNLRCDSPQFRVKLLFAIRLFLIRVLRSCLSRIKTKCVMDETIDNLRQLYDRLLNYLTPSCCHQKKITLLDVLCYIQQLFGAISSQAENVVKGVSLSDHNELVKLAGGRWNFTGKESLDRYTTCLLMDGASDVRLKAAQLLRDFFPSPPSDYVRLLYNQGLALCENSGVEHSECGAVIFQLVCHWSSANNSITQGPIADFLVGEICKRFHQLKLNWKVGASDQPAVHGLMGALIKVLQVTNSEHLTLAYTDLITLARMISCYMLNVLTKESTESPVFRQDITPLLGEMSSSTDDLAFVVPIESNGVFNDLQRQSILTCAWLNLKESGNLAMQIATLLLNDERSSKEERVHSVKNCVHIVYQILLICSREEAVDAVGDAMGLLCRKLFINEEEEMRAIPGQMLGNFLERLEDSKLDINASNRSTGMAFLVNNIVNSQSGNSPSNSLLTMATRRLIHVAEHPVGTSDEQNYACNSRQAVAIQILKSLVQEASLNVDVQPELMELMVKLGVDSFVHPHWSVRNAALQLHGVVVAHLVGSSRKTTADLFHKLPGLESFFLGKLAEHSDVQRIYVGDLMPVLSILSRLSPDYRNEYRNTRFKFYLMALLGHPAIQVRKLVGRSLLAFVPLPKTKLTAMQLCEDALTLASRHLSATPLHMCVRGSSVTNSLHGCLLAILEFINRCREIAISVQDWEMIRNSVSAFLSIENNHPSFYIKLTILNIFKVLKGMAGSIEFFRVYRDESVRQLYCHQPGFGKWLMLKTEHVLTEGSLNSVLEAHSMAIQEFLAFYSGFEVVESAMRSLMNRFARFSRSSVMANHINSYITYFISHWQSHPSLVPVSLEFIQIRGAAALQESETSLSEHMDFLLNTCMEMRQLGSAIALLAIPTASIVIKETFEKGLLLENVDDIAVQLSRCLLKASQPEESLSFRLAAAASLKTTGKALMEKAMNNAELTRNLFFLIMHLIHDEAKEVRADTAFFLTELVSSIKSDPHKHPRLSHMNPEECLEELSSLIHHWFSKQHLIPVIVDLLTDAELENDDEVNVLCELETQNVLNQEPESVFLLIKLVDSLLGTVESDRKPFVLDIDLKKVIEGAERTVRSIRSNPSYREGTSEWFFTQSARIYPVVIRLSARLSIIARCCPPFKRESRFMELCNTVGSLLWYKML